MVRDELCSPRERGPRASTCGVARGGGPRRSFGPDARLCGGSTDGDSRAIPPSTTLSIPTGDPNAASAVDATKLASILRQLYTLRSALGAARHEARTLRGERDAAVKECGGLREENEKLKYRITHLIRAVREDHPSSAGLQKDGADDRSSRA